MDQETLFKLMQNFDTSSIRELSLDLDGAHIYLNKNQNAKPTEPSVITASQVAPQATNSEPSTPKEQEKPKARPTDQSVIKAQLVGVVYLQPAPGKKNYVHVGDHIQKGQTICVIEAMKMLTEVKSEVDGTIVSIDVNNEEMVDYDQPLVTLQKD